MSSPFADGVNPYQQTPIPQGPLQTMPAGQFQSSVDFLRAFSFIFENPSWLVNALWAFLCNIAAQVIPVAPQMVLLGYQFEILDGLLCTKGVRYPDFDVNRLGDYLARGLWPMLVAIVISIAWMPIFIIYLIAAIAGIVASTAETGPDGSPFVTLIVIGLTVLVGISLFILLGFLALPGFIRSGMTQSFGEAFNLGWTIDFWKKTWVEILGTAIVLSIINVGLIFATCGIGALLIMPLMPFVASHFMYQFYNIYLSRGGIPVAMKSVAYGGVPQPPMASPPPMPPGFPPKPPG